MFEAFGAINEETVLNFQSERSVIDQAANMLAEAGFEVLQVNEYTINIAGTQKTFEQAFETKLQTEERPVIKEGAREDTATFVECPETGIPGLIDTSKTGFRDVLEGVAIEEPRYFMAPSKFAPLKSYWHLRVPAGFAGPECGPRTPRGHHGKRNQGSDGRQRPLQAPVLRWPRISCWAGSLGTWCKQSVA